MLAITGLTLAWADLGASRHPPRPAVPPAQTVVFDCPGQHALVRPKTFILTCADGNAFFGKLAWTSWTPGLASAKGTLVLNDCTPVLRGRALPPLSRGGRPVGQQGGAGRPGERCYTMLTEILTGQRPRYYDAIHHKWVTAPVTQTMPAADLADRVTEAAWQSFAGTRLSSRRLALAAGALICAAAVAGCASSGRSQPGTSGSTPAASPTAPGRLQQQQHAGRGVAVLPAAAGPAACPTSSLQVKLGVSQGYAGGVYQVIDFTNTSGSTCTLYGYPGVSLVSGPPYKQIGLAAKRSTSTPLKLVTLAPGATANALLQIVDALNFPSASCGPTKATALKIYPPNQTAPVYLPNTSNGCAKSVQIMYIGAVRPGSGSSS